MELNWLQVQEILPATKPILCQVRDYFRPIWNTSSTVGSKQGFADWQWHGGECMQVADSTTLKGGMRWSEMALIITPPPA